MTERLDRIEGAIEQLNSTINVLVTEFIRPNAQQARANFERLERIESTLDRAAAQTVANAEQLSTNEQQIANNAEAIAGTRQLVQANAEAIATNEQRFEVMRGDVNADRQQWQAAADADRAENRRRFDAQQQIAQAMLVELSRVNSRLEVLEVS